MNRSKESAPLWTKLFQISMAIEIILIGIIAFYSQQNPIMTQSEFFLAFIITSFLPILLLTYVFFTIRDRRIYIISGVYREKYKKNYISSEDNPRLFYTHIFLAILFAVITIIVITVIVLS